MTRTSEGGHLLSQQDLANTPLGPLEKWPQSLRTAVVTMMASGHAMCLAWGPERVFLYNDAYAPMLGARHPNAFGARFEDVWHDVWSDIEPLVEATFHGKTSTFEDMPLTMSRNGRPEETWWTFSYSPVRDEHGNVAGLLNVTLETTSRVLVERERDQAIERLRINEAKWRRLFETLEEGFILATVIRDGNGQIVDWRYEEVNKAWYELVGVEQGQAEGHTIRELFPDIEDDWVRGLAGVVDTTEAVHFTRQVGSMGRWYDGVAQAVEGDHFTVIFSEVTDRVLREQRQEAIIELSDALQQEKTADGMTEIAAGILRRLLGVGLVGFGDVDASAETVTVKYDQIANQTQMIAKTLQFRKFGSFVDDLKMGQAVVVSDGRSDPRTREHTDALEARKIRSFVSTPVIERGNFVALLYVTNDKPRTWQDEELQFIREVASRLRSAIERVRALEQEEMLNGELSHRIKNTLSVVQAIATQSLKTKADAAAVQEFSERLKALSSAHDVLLTRNWAAADLKDIAEAALVSFATNQVEVHGPPLRIGSRTAMSLSLLLHELATNAGKYGALSVPEGQVSLRWSLNVTADGQDLAMTWSERGGPPAVEPTRRGFGSRIIRMGLTGSGGVQQNFGSEGLTVEMTAPLHQVQQG